MEVITANDPIIKSQQYCLVSYAFNAKKLMKKCNIFGIKIRGVFATLEAAKIAAEQIRSYDNKFDIYCGDIVGKMIPLYPTENDVKEIKYDEAKLTELMNTTHMKKPLYDYNPFKFTDGPDDELLYKDIDMLEVDKPIGEQRIALVSLYTPEIINKCTSYTMKIRGVASSPSRANLLRDKLAKFDKKTVNIYQLPVGYWCAINLQTKLKEDPHDGVILNELVGSILSDRQKERAEYLKRVEMSKQNINQPDMPKNENIDKALEKLKNDQLNETKTETNNMDEALSKIDDLLGTKPETEKAKPFIMHETRDNGKTRQKMLQAIIQKRKQEKEQQKLQEQAQNQLPNMNAVPTDKLIASMPEEPPINALQTITIDEHVNPEINEKFLKLKDEFIHHTKNVDDEEYC
jgi:hypothetical protein